MLGADASLTTVSIKVSGIIPAPIEDTWSVTRKFGEPGYTEGQVGTLRRVGFAMPGGPFQFYVEQLEALDDEQFTMKWKLVSHPDNANPFPGTFLNYRSMLQLYEVTMSNQTYIEWQGQFDTSPQEVEAMHKDIQARYQAGVAGLCALMCACGNGPALLPPRLIGSSASPIISTLPVLLPAPPLPAASSVFSSVALLPHPLPLAAPVLPPTLPVTSSASCVSAAPMMAGLCGAIPVPPLASVATTCDAAMRLSAAHAPGLAQPAALCGEAPLATPSFPAAAATPQPRAAAVWVASIDGAGAPGGYAPQPQWGAASLPLRPQAPAAVPVPLAEGAQTAPPGIVLHPAMPAGYIPPPPTAIAGHAQASAFAATLTAGLPSPAGPNLNDSQGGQHAAPVCAEAFRVSSMENGQGGAACPVELARICSSGGSIEPSPTAAAPVATPFQAASVDAPPSLLAAEASGALVMGRGGTLAGEVGKKGSKASSALSAASMGSLASVAPKVPSLQAPLRMAVQASMASTEELSQDLDTALMRSAGGEALPHGDALPPGTGCVRK